MQRSTATLFLAVTVTLLAFSVAPLTASAATITIDFQSAPPGSFSSLQLGDFVFTSTFSYGDAGTVADVGGGNFALVDPTAFSGSAEVVMTEIHGQTFTVNSLVMGNTDSLSLATLFRIGATTAGVFTYPYAVYFPAQGSQVLVTNFMNVDKLWINNDSFGFGFGKFFVDDINITYVQVPEPASLALLGLGGLAAALRARRRAGR